MVDLDTTETAILGRAINPDSASWSEDASRSILDISLGEADAGRRDALAEKARKGTLTEKEEAELENFRHVGRILELMKAKARVSLKKSKLAS